MHGSADVFSIGHRVTHAARLKRLKAVASHSTAHGAAYRL
jgi:hypothetical protein